MTNEQASDWEYKIICCLGISTSNSDINVVGLHKTVKELYEQGRADEREPQVCCGEYQKCMKACTPRGRWLAEKELAKPEQEPVAWMLPDYGDVLSASEADGTGIYNIPLYTAPPSKPWVGLTDDEILSAAKEVPITCIRQRDYDLHFAPIIEAKLKEKNNAL